MKPPLVALLAALAAIVPNARAEKLPASLFARGVAYHAVEISPDGKTVAYIAGVGEEGTKHVLVFMDLATGARKVIQAPDVWSDGENIEEIQGFNWLSEGRVVFHYSRPDSLQPMPGTAAVDRDGSGFRDFPAYTQGFDDVPGYARIFFVPGNSNHYLGLSYAMGSTRDHPIVYDIDTTPGRSGNVEQGRADVTSQAWSVVVDDTEGMTDWVPDQAGNIRVGIDYDGQATRVITRPGDDAAWQPVPDFDCKGLGGFPMAVDWDGNTAYTATLTPSGTWGVSSYDLAARKMGPVIAADKAYDILCPSDYMGSRGYLLFSRKHRKLVGISYPTATQRTVWFDSEFAGVQAAMDRALPGMINAIWNWSDDESKLLVYSWSDRSPGTYYIFDRDARKLHKLFDAAPWIVPSQMGRVYPISFKSRDGFVIHGYLTVPAGTAPKNLPVVVATRPEIYFTRSSLKFVPILQFLASRGYAVLEINPRGSPGYGKAFYEAGKQQVGRGIQMDITEGVRWAIARGIADPRRIAIIGSNFGGYTAELALTQTPELYRCGVSADAICDMTSYLNSFETGTGIFQKAGASANSEVLAYMKERIGDPATDGAMLREISPVNHVDRIRVPILLVSHKTVLENLANQTDRFESALKARGAACERKDFPVSHSNMTAMNQEIEYLNLLDDFLARNMK